MLSNTTFKTKTMKQTFIKIALLSVSSFFINEIQAQVTIGLNTEPVIGALLQLKEKDINGNIANSEKGLMMPRVALNQKEYTGSNLAMTINYSDTYINWDINKHIGLTVYNVTHRPTDGLCRGLYTWTGEAWEKLGKQCDGYTGGGTGGSSSSLSLNLNGGDQNLNLQFPSGKKPTVINPENVGVTWAPGTLNPYVNTSNSGSYPPVSFETLPTISTSGTGVGTIPIKPAPIPQYEIDNSPFITKESIVKVDLADPNTGQVLQKEIVVNQTNKELLVNNSKNPTPGRINNSTTTTSVNVNTNAKYNIVLPNDGSISLQSPSNGGQELYNGGSNTFQETFYVNPALTKRKNYITFTDSESTKRFDDVVYTIMNCDVYKEDTLEQSLNLWQRLYCSTGNCAEGTNGDKSNPHSVQYHRDRSGRLFFSAIFGTTRWMTTNLATTVSETLTLTPTHSVLTDLVNNPSYNIFYYSYPRTTYDIKAQHGTVPASISQIYNDFNRLGLLYDWATAGTVCNPGWHLPSAAEFNTLISTIRANPTYYSSDPNDRDVTSIIKESCNGSSLSFLEGGFDALNAGLYSSGYGNAYRPLQHFSKHIYFWTSTLSGGLNRYAYIATTNTTTTKIVEPNGDTLGEFGNQLIIREVKGSVRCIKD